MQRSGRTTQVQDKITWPTSSNHVMLNQLPPRQMLNLFNQLRTHADNLSILI